MRAIHELVKAHPRRGCRYITECLRRDGWRVNHKRVHRLWKLEGFRVPVKRHKKRAIGDKANACDKRAAMERNDVWAWDFIHDRTVKGRLLKFLVIVDEYTRECLCLKTAHSFTSDDVLDVLASLMPEQGVPRHIRSDNGSEYIARNLCQWLGKMGVETLFIAPGSPWQNGYAESFNSRVRNEFLEMHYFHSLAEAQQLAAAWKEYYNNHRPHLSLNNKTPREFAALCLAGSSTSLRSVTQPARQRAPEYETLPQELSYEMVQKAGA